MNSQSENTASTSLFGATNQDMMCTPNQRKSRRRTQTPSEKKESGRKSSYKNQIVEDPEECPLKDLTIYVEIFSNKVNISETAYKQLEELGAQIEKRMNKKCNLVIWKDGSPKTLERAKRYDIPVVNSLWLADCVDNFKRADVSKYTPSKTDQEVALFSARKTKKRKRFALENLHSETKSDRKHSRPAMKRLSSLETHQTKIRKKSSLSKQNSNSKITIKLNQRKSSKKREVARSLSFDTNPKKTKRGGRSKSQKKKAPPVSKILFRSGSLHRRIVKTRNPDLGTLEDYKVRSLPESEDEASEKSYYNSERMEVSSPGSLDIDGILAEREKVQESTRIREMILRYASAEYSVAVESFNMVSDQDTNIDEENDLDFSVKSPIVRPFEYCGQPFDSQPMENNPGEIEFSQLQPDCGGAMLEEKDDEEDLKQSGIEIEDEEEKCEKEVAIEQSKEICCESPPMDTLKPESSNTLETPVTKAGSSMNKDSTEKGFSTPSVKKSSDMKALIDNIYSDFKGIDEEVKDSSAIRGRRITREQISGGGRNLNWTLRSESNSKKEKSSLSKNDDLNKNTEVSVPIVPVTTARQTRQSRPKKSTIVAKGLIDSGLGKIKAKQNPIYQPQPRPQSQPRSQSATKVILMEEEKVANEEVQSEKKHNVLFSNLKRTELLKMKEFCDKYGLNYLEDRINNAENIEIMVAEKQEIPQNFKAAMVMAKGKAIVKREWIVSCMKKDKLLNYQDFIVRYNHDQRKNLFSNKKFYIDPEIEDMPINMIQVQDISRLITASGGTVSQDLKDCDFCIRRKTTKKELAIPSNTKAVTLQWLIDSVLDGKIMDTNNSNYRII